MPRLSLLLLANLAALTGRAEQVPGTTGAWHYVNVEAVVCPGGAGWTTVDIDRQTGEVFTPHIFTVFRTSKEAVTLRFEVRDANGKIVANEGQGVALQSLTHTEQPPSQTLTPTLAPVLPTLPPIGDTTQPSQTLMPTVAPVLPTVPPIGDTIQPSQTLMPLPDMPTLMPMPSLPSQTLMPTPAMPDTPTLMPMPSLPPQMLISTGTDAPPQARRLSSRRRSGGSYSSPRRRAPSPASYSPRRRSYSSPRRRAPSPASYSPRRRASASPRRRGSPTVTSPRRRGGSAVTTPRRRGGPAVTTPRRRSPGGLSSVRRRTSNFNAPRRRGYYPAGARRRTYGYGGSQYSNPYSPAAGRYGYPNQHSIYNNYGGRPPMGTPYGYSGANAYQGHSGAKIAMALAGGAAIGIGGSYLYNHWSHGGFGNMAGLSCSRAGGAWSGSCHDCTSMFAASSCMTKLSPSFDAARDDLMDTGFVPADFTFPLRVNVTRVEGLDYLAARICPPVGWTPEQNGTWQPPRNGSLFITLTAMKPLSAVPADGGGNMPGGVGTQRPPPDRLPRAGDQNNGNIAGGMVFACATLCCGAVAAAVCCAHRSGKRHHAGWSSSSDSDDEGLPPPHVVTPFPHRPLQNYAGGGGGGFSPGAPGRAGGFLSTSSPNGRSWEDYCQRQQAFIDSSGIVGGSWGECLAWAKVYELQNPDWEDDPQYRNEGPCGQVISAMVEAAPDYMRDELLEAGVRTEELCTACAERGEPLPIIGWEP